VGNRAFGSRIHAEAGVRKAKLAAAMVLTAPFVPMLFQGEEFAASSPFLYFAHHEDPVLARAVSEGRRREHSHHSVEGEIPDPELQETFERSKLHWDELEEPEHAAMVAWYRSLVSLRISQPSLLDGDRTQIEVRFDEEQGWLSMRRGAVQLLYNFGGSAVLVDAFAEGRILLASDAEVQVAGGKVSLPSSGFAAIERA
jgi:maltooligosyltrehalose trehalohydrolase